MIAQRASRKDAALLLELTEDPPGQARRGRRTREKQTAGQRFEWCGQALSNYTSEKAVFGFKKNGLRAEQRPSGVHVA